MSSAISNWFEEAKGLRLEDPNNGVKYTLIDLRSVGSELYFGLLPADGPVVYVNIDRYDDLISIA